MQKRSHTKRSQFGLHAVLCAAGYNIRWLLRMMAKKRVAFLWRLYLRLRWLACGRLFTPSSPLERSAGPAQRLSITSV